MKKLLLALAAIALLATPFALANSENRNQCAPAGGIGEFMKTPLRVLFVGFLVANPGIAGESVSTCGDAP
jgi:hypothetical protein